MLLNIPAIVGWLTSVAVLVPALKDELRTLACQFEQYADTLEALAREILKRQDRSISLMELIPISFIVSPRCLSRVRRYLLSSAMNTSEDLELQMREALGFGHKPKKKLSEASNPMRGYLIILSVRGEGGPAFRYEHRSRSLSRTEAVLDAEKTARAEGYRPWVLIDVIEA